MGVNYPGGEMVGRFRAKARANYLRAVQKITRMEIGQSAE